MLVFECTSPPVVLSQGRAEDIVKVTVSKTVVAPFVQSSLYVRTAGGLESIPVDSPAELFKAFAPLQESDALQDVALVELHLKVWDEPLVMLIPPPNPARVPSTVKSTVIPEGVGVGVAVGPTYVG